MKTILQVLLMLTLSCGLAFGQTAEKATAATNASTNFAFHSSPAPPSVGAFFNAVTAHIKTPGGQSDLLVTFSAITVLVAFSANANKSPVVVTSTVGGTAINVQLMVDENVVPFAALPSPPGPITVVALDNLVKSTNLFIDPPITTDTLVQLFSLGGVRSVTWAVPNVGNGEHTVTVQAQFVLSDQAVPVGTLSGSSTEAFLGPRTLAVQAVDIKNF